jgi:hypothetical protein
MTDVYLTVVAAIAKDARGREALKLLGHMTWLRVSTRTEGALLLA